MGKALFENYKIIILPNHYTFLDTRSGRRINSTEYVNVSLSDDSLPPSHAILTFSLFENSPIFFLGLVVDLSRPNLSGDNHLTSVGANLRTSI